MFGNPTKYLRNAPCVHGPRSLPNVGQPVPRPNMHSDLPVTIRQSPEPLPVPVEGKATDRILQSPHVYLRYAVEAYWFYAASSEDYDASPCLCDTVIG